MDPQLDFAVLIPKVNIKRLMTFTITERNNMNLLHKALVYIFSLFFMAGGLAQAAAQNDYGKELQSLPFPEHYPTQETTDKLANEMLFHRATQIVIWSLCFFLWITVILKDSRISSQKNMLARRIGQCAA